MAIDIMAGLPLPRVVTVPTDSPVAAPWPINESPILIDGSPNIDATHSDSTENNDNGFISPITNSVPIDAVPTRPRRRSTLSTDGNSLLVEYCRKRVSAGTAESSDLFSNVPVDAIRICTPERRVTGSVQPRISALTADDSFLPMVSEKRISNLTVESGDFFASCFRSDETPPVCPDPVPIATGTKCVSTLTCDSDIFSRLHASFPSTADAKPVCPRRRSTIESATSDLHQSMHDVTMALRRVDSGLSSDSSIDSSARCSPRGRTISIDSNCDEQDANPAPAPIEIEVESKAYREVQQEQREQHHQQQHEEQHEEQEQHYRKSMASSASEDTEQAEMIQEIHGMLLSLLLRGRKKRGGNRGTLSRSTRNRRTSDNNSSNNNNNSTSNRSRSETNKRDNRTNQPTNHSKSDHKSLRSIYQRASARRRRLEGSHSSHKHIHERFEVSNSSRNTGADREASEHKSRKKNGPRRHGSGLEEFIRRARRSASKRGRTHPSTTGSPCAGSGVDQSSRATSSEEEKCHRTPPPRFKPIPPPPLCRRKQSNSPLSKSTHSPTLQHHRKVGNSMHARSARSLPTGAVVPNPFLREGSRGTTRRHSARDRPTSALITRKELEEILAAKMKEESDSY
jgi:hypothetical protein